MKHLDRELHKLAIALECEQRGESLALICTGAHSFSIVRLYIDISGRIEAKSKREIGSGATAVEAFDCAYRLTQLDRDELTRTYFDRRGVPVGLPDLTRKYRRERTR